MCCVSFGNYLVPVYSVQVLEYEYERTHTPVVHPECRKRRVTPHVARNDRRRRSAIDGRTTRHPGYAMSQRLRKRVEEVFGWEKTVGGLRKLRYIGRRAERALRDAHRGRLQPRTHGEAGGRRDVGNVHPPPSAAGIDRAKPLIRSLHVTDGA